MSYNDRSNSSGAFAKASMHRRSACALLQKSAVSRDRGQGEVENCHDMCQCACKGDMSCNMRRARASLEHKQAIFVLPGSQFERAEGSRVTSLRTPARGRAHGAHARRPAYTHEYTPRRAVEGRHAHPAAAMLFEAARKCVRNKLRSVQLLYYVQHLGPVRGVVLTAHARPA